MCITQIHLCFDCIIWVESNPQQEPVASLWRIVKLESGCKRKHFLQWGTCFGHNHWCGHIHIIPTKFWTNIRKPTLSPTDIVLKMGDNYLQTIIGVLKNVTIQVEEFKMKLISRSWIWMNIMTATKLFMDNLGWITCLAAWELKSAGQGEARPKKDMHSSGLEHSSAVCGMHIHQFWEC